MGKVHPACPLVSKEDSLVVSQTLDTISCCRCPLLLKKVNKKREILIDKQIKKIHIKFTKNVPKIKKIKLYG